MKIQLDTNLKTIKLESNVSLAKLVDTLEKLLPNGEWKEFTLETNTVISYWTNPIVIEKYYPTYPIIPNYPAIPSYPWYTTICGTDSNKQYAVNKTESVMSLNSGVYNIQA